ncbi:hypothetical protein BASA81_003852 [Batrachochytrium salamandrivorans]|nr:hypothetical protein BASA81_003852 [Batrachochytrium salamandrivorans]
MRATCLADSKQRRLWNTTIPAQISRVERRRQLSVGLAWLSSKQRDARELGDLVVGVAQGLEEYLLLRRVKAEIKLQLSYLVVFVHQRLHEGVNHSSAGREVYKAVAMLACCVRVNGPT